MRYWRSVRPFSILAAFVTLTGIAYAQLSQPSVVDLFDGLDPVELVAGREVPGRANLTVEHRGYRYLFASPENLAAFRENPARYEPANGGSCARMGAGGPGNPAMFEVFDGRIYLFSSESCRKAFAAAPESFIEPAPVIDAPSQAARAQGRAIVERAVAAIGGAERLDALRGYRLERGRLRGTPQGPMILTERVTALFPDAVRTETRAPQGAMAAAAAGDDMFLVTERQGAARLLRFPEASRVAAARDQMRRILLDPIGLLRARATAGAAAIEGGSATAALDHVRMTVRGTQVVLGVDATSGLPATLTFNARSSSGAWQPLTLTFTDFRVVDGLRVPFKVDGAFAGVRADRESYELSSWTANPPVTRDDLMRETLDGGQR